MTDSKASKKPRRNRRKSRELVLKGLYGIFLSGHSIQKTLQDLAEDDDYALADQDFLIALLTGVVEHVQELDERMQPFMEREADELSPVEHAVLCISGYELIYDLSIPYRVAINEGVELTKRFGGIDGFKFVNGVLDKLAAEVREGEFQSKR